MQFNYCKGLAHEIEADTKVDLYENSNCKGSLKRTQKDYNLAIKLQVVD